MSAWTPKRAVALSKRHLGAACEKLLKVAAVWEDVDQVYIDEADRLIRELEEFSERIDAEVKDRLACGEHIGI